jgi:hypothetical protein
MTQKEIVQILHDKYGYKKTPLRNMKIITEVAEREGYVLYKRGVDNYDLIKKDYIMDFTKPLKFFREIPELATTEKYNGVPLGYIMELFYYGDLDYKIWCYIMNKKDGDVLRFKEIADLGWKDCDNVLLELDIMTYYGFLREKTDHLEVYTYPIGEKLARYEERYVPCKYLE